MRQIVIDELSPMESDNLDSYLKRTLQAGPLIGLFWLVMPPEQLSDIQQAHEGCSPYYCAVELENSRLKVELLVRSSSNLHCDCIAHATKDQRRFILHFIDRMLEEEQISA
jgi:hypothetical protein